MFTSLQRRLGDLPFSDPVTRQQASLIQTMLLTIALVSFVGAFVALLAPISLTDAIVVIAIVWLGVPIAGIGIWLLHRGNFGTAVLLTCVGLILLLSFLLITTGVQGGGALLFGFALPIVLAGLLAGRATLMVMIGCSAGSILLTILFERTNMPLIGMAAPRGENIGGILGGFVVIAAILGVFVARFGHALRDALAEAQHREQRLESFQKELEGRVAERTSELQTALREVEARAETQAHLLEENERQRAMIQELSVPVLPVSANTLVVPVVGNLDDRRMQILQERLLHAIEHSTMRRAIIDISGIPLVDSQVAQGILDVVRQTRLLGAEAVLVGVRPEVAQALVTLGVDLHAMHTFRDLETALRHER